VERKGEVFSKKKCTGERNNTRPESVGGKVLYPRARGRTTSKKGRGGGKELLRKGIDRSLNKQKQAKRGRGSHEKIEDQAGCQCRVRWSPGPLGGETKGEG